MVLEQNPLDIGHRPEDVDPATSSEVVVTDEPDDLVAEVRLAFVGVHQTNGVRIGSDDHDPPGDLTVGTKLGEHPARHLALDEQRDDHRCPEEEHPEPRELVVLENERDREHRSDTGTDGLDDVPGLFLDPLVRPGEVEMVQAGRQREAGNATMSSASCLYTRYWGTGFIIICI